MNLLKKIKFNYYLKLIEDYISNDKYQLAFSEILKLKISDIQIFAELLNKLDNQLRDISNAQLFQQKIVWTVSYDLDDLEYVNSFLKFYLQKNIYPEFAIKNFTDSLSEYAFALNQVKNNYEIKFNEMIKYSSFYQNLLLFEKDNDLKVLNTCSAFFESKDKNYFIYPNTTLCYFYIIRNPKDIYIKYKKKYGSIEAAYEELLNNSNKLYLNFNQNHSHKIFENRVNYNINLKSWTDPNVVSTYKGKMINFNNLASNTEEALLDIIYHFKQHYPKLPVMIEDIKEFISKNKLINETDLELTQKEIKFLSKNIAYNDF